MFAHSTFNLFIVKTLQVVSHDFTVIWYRQTWKCLFEFFSSYFSNITSPWVTTQTNIALRILQKKENQNYFFSLRLEMMETLLGFHSAWCQDFPQKWSYFSPSFLICQMEKFTPESSQCNEGLGKKCKRCRYLYLWKKTILSETHQLKSSELQSRWKPQSDKWNKILSIYVSSFYIPALLSTYGFNRWFSG